MINSSSSRWLGIAGSLMVGLFVAYIDRSNLSVGLAQIANDLGFAGADSAVTSSWLLTIFLIGYAVANILGGIFTRGKDPKWVVIAMFSLWSVATIVAGFATSVAVLLVCRLILGIAEGVYWPQQSRFVSNWFAPRELTRANSIIQYYGQFGALALGFFVLTPICDAIGWRNTFFLTGAIGLLVIVPLYLLALKPQSQAPYYQPPSATGPARLTFKALGGSAFVLLVLSYITQGMLFWGITLWIPMVVKSLGYSGWSQAAFSALPYFAALLLAVPMSIISDRSNKRVLVASLGLIIPGAILLLLPQFSDGYPKLMVLTVAMGFYASSYTPNIWSILQTTVEPQAVGPASGIMNGLGAGGGGTLAGFMVGLLHQATGSYTAGFVVLGALVVLGGVLLLVSGGLSARGRRRLAATPALPS